MLTDIPRLMKKSHSAKMTKKVEVRPSQKGPSFALYSSQKRKSKLDTLVGRVALSQSRFDWTIRLQISLIDNLPEKTYNVHQPGLVTFPTDISSSQTGSG